MARSRLRIAGLLVGTCLAANDAFAFPRVALIIDESGCAHGGVLADALMASPTIAAPRQQAESDGVDLGASLAPTASADAWDATVDADFTAAVRRAPRAAPAGLVDAPPEGGGPVELTHGQSARAPVFTNVSEPASSDDADRCQAETARLAALRNNPSVEEISAFATEMTCSALRPQLARLAESMGLTGPLPPASASRLTEPNQETAACARDERDLEMLLAELDLAHAEALYGRVTCASLKPQLHRLVESLREASSTSQPTVATQAPVSDDPAGACAAEANALARLRARPDREAVRALARNLRCKELEPQVTRLSESLGMEGNPNAGK